MIRNIVLALLLAAGVALAMAPIGPMPGVWLGGTATAAPADWRTVELPMTVQLKTSGGLLPRVVNIWIVEADNELYVFGARDSGWVQAALQDPAVTLRMGDAAYALNAVAAEDRAPAAYVRYLDRYRADFPELVGDLPADSADFEGGAAFRLAR
jgi:hypothetical protein